MTEKLTDIEDESPKCSVCGTALDWIFRPSFGLRCPACGLNAERPLSHGVRAREIGSPGAT